MKVEVLSGLRALPTFRAVFAQVLSRFKAFFARGLEEKSKTVRGQHLSRITDYR
jgi:hypothetical protein